MTWRSYCSQIQRLEAMSGQQTTESTASAQLSGAGTSFGSRRGCSSGWTQGRSYRGASSNRGASGTSQTVSPWCFSTSRPVSVVMPMTAASRPHFSKMRWPSCSRPGLSTASIRSWLSDSIIS